MNRKITRNFGVPLLAITIIATLGVVYGVEISRQVSGSTIVGRVVTVDETILLYSQVKPSTADLTELGFGAVDINAFGLFNMPPRIPLWIGNGGGVPFTITLEQTDVTVNGSAVTGDVLSLLLGQPNGELLPSPDHAALINPGEVVGFNAGLRFLGTPQTLDIGTGDTVTFTALFIAEGPLPPPTPTPTPTPTQTPTPTPTATPVPGQVHEVQTFDIPLRYEPQDITISAGDSVRWVNPAVDQGGDQFEPHTATEGQAFEGNPEWSTSVIFPGEQSDPVTFNTPGAFPFWCQIHPEDMTGTITVVQ